MTSARLKLTTFPLSSAPESGLGLHELCTKLADVYDYQVIKEIERLRPAILELRSICHLRRGCSGLAFAAGNDLPHEEGTGASPVK